MPEEINIQRDIEDVQSEVIRTAINRIRFSNLGTNNYSRRRVSREDEIIREVIDSEPERLISSEMEGTLSSGEERFWFNSRSNNEDFVTDSRFSFQIWKEKDNKKIAPSNEKGEVKLFDKDEYVKPELCIFIPGIGGYFKNDDKRLNIDYFTKQHIIIDPKILAVKPIKVYKKIDNKGKLYDFEYTIAGESRNRDYKLPVVMVSNSKCFVETSLLFDPIFKVKYKEDLNNGKFYKSNALRAVFNKIPKIQFRKSKGILGHFYNSMINKPFTYSSTFNKKYSFGVELETCSGYLPEYVDNFLYYSAVHDGSLRDDDDNNAYGGEYVTDVLEGDTGLKQLKMLCNEITKRCLVNKKCSVHVHLGKVVFDKENIVLMYYLYQKIQKEVFSMMPHSRRDNDYCRFLPEIFIDLQAIELNRNFAIDHYYNQIMVVLSKKDNCSKNINKKKDHPQGFKCGYDHSTARYCWVNFIPAVFDTRKTSRPIEGLKGHFTDPVQTIEFRPMSATTNYNKVKSWLLICMALVDIVENHKQKIYNNKILTLGDIISNCYPKNSAPLIDFIEKRKVKFADKDFNEEIEFAENDVDDNLSLKSI